MWEDLEHDRFFSDPSRRPPRTGLVVFVSIIVSAATAGGLYLALGAAASARPIPALVGLPLHEALVLARKTGLRLVVSGSTPDPLVTKGAVASQSPLAGTTLPAGAPVRVVLSDGLTAPQGRPLPPVDPGGAPSPSAPLDAGPVRAMHKQPTPHGGDRPAVTGDKRAVAVPRLIGLRISHARRRLHRTGLEVGRVGYGVDEDRMDGRVLRQTPQPGARVELGTTVDVVVNRTAEE